MNRLPGESVCFPTACGNIWDEMEMHVGIFVSAIVDGGSMLEDGYGGYICNYTARNAISVVPKHNANSRRKIR